MPTRKPNSKDRLKKVQLALYLDEEQLEALKVLSAHTRVAQQEYLREGLMYVLKRYGVKRREQQMYIVGADTLTDAELRSFDAAIQAARHVAGLQLAFIRSEPVRGADGKLCEVRVYEGLTRGVKAVVPIRPNGKPGPAEAS
jgi:Ribbon-helix-helix domain